MPGRPSRRDLQDALAAHYEGSAFVRVIAQTRDDAPETLNPQALNGTNRLDLYVLGNDETGQVQLLAVLDNLGKGASGAAVQNLNLMCGLPEAAGL
jgi:N-acetyl-gamma-glutamyl-phosphate reductase